MATGRDIAVINVPSDIGSMIKGKSLAPEAIRQANLIDKLKSAGYKVIEREALSDGPKIWSSDASFAPYGIRDEDRNIMVCHEVKNAVSEALKKGHNASNTPFSIVVGGGCEIAPAVMSAFWTDLSPQRIGLLYIDADCDLTTVGEPGSSGNIASMTMTNLMMKEGSLESMKAFTIPDGTGVVDNSNAVIFGINSENQSNKRSQLGYFFDEGYRIVTSAAIAKDPVRRAKQALEWLEERVDRIVVHLDVDSIDATIFPLANLPQYTGAGFPEIMSAVKVFLSSKKTAALVIAEVNPDHDPGLKMTNRLVNELVEGFKQKISTA